MALTQKDFTRALTWSQRAFEVGVKIVEKLDAGKTTAFLSDVLGVANAYLEGAKTLVPTNGVDPWPKNFFSQLNWLRKNASVIGAFLFNGQSKDPFVAGRKLASDFATKYNFTY